MVELANSVYESLSHTTYQVAAMVLALLFLQRTVGRRIPSRIYCLAWVLIFVRLLAPTGLQTDFSLYGVFSSDDSVGQTESSTPEAVASASLTRELGLDVATAAEARPGRQQSADTLAATQNTTLVLASIWLIGVLLVFAVTAKRTLRFRRICNAACLIGDEQILAILSETKTAIGTRRHVRLSSSERIDGPLVAGVLRPQILVPSHLVSKLAPEEWRCLFLHELAHVHRSDLAVSWLATAAVAMHWFNPFAWVAASRFRRDRELACDQQAVAKSGSDSRSYGLALLRVMDRLVAPTGVPALLPVGNDKRDARERIRALAEFKQPTKLVVATTAMAVIALAVVLMSQPATADNSIWRLGDLSVDRGWFLSGGGRSSYETSLDGDVVYDGRATLRLGATTETPLGYGTLMQSRSAQPFRNRRVRMKAMVKGAGITGRGDMWMRVQAVDGPSNGPGLGGGSCPLRASFGWQPCTIIADVPNDGDTVQLGVGLAGAGSIWLGKVTLEFEDSSEPLPPNSTVVSSTLVNGNFEADERQPTGWFLAGNSRDQFLAAIDERTHHDGLRSVRLEAKPRYQRGYGTLMQSLVAAKYRGNRMRLVAYLRGDGVAGRGDMWLRVQAVDSPGDGAGLGAGSCQLSGTFGWKRCEFVFEVSKSGHSVQFGAGLDGPGTLWIDAVTLEVVSKATPLKLWQSTTN